MRLTFKQLKGYAVVTERGTSLGHVIDLVLSDDHHVVQYIVKKQMIGGTQLTIAATQVVRFEEQKMIVDDTLTKQEISDKTSTPSVGSSEAVAMIESE